MANELDNGTPQSTTELATAGAASSAQHEIQSAIIIAKRMPRNEDDCFQKLMKAARRLSFAEEAEYRFPRGKTPDGKPNYVTGPSVNLAREAARIWGNIRFGLYIVRDDEQTRLIRGWAWDVETNTKVEADDDFQKLIQRKKDGNTVWLQPDERDLRELTNRRGAIVVRNAILQVLPKDLIEDALYQCEKTREEKAAEDPDRTRKRLLVDFSGLNVSVENLEKKLGHPFAKSSSKELAELRAIYQSIMDGHTTWAEYAKEPEQVPEKDVQQEKLKAAQEALKQQQEQAKTSKPVESSGHNQQMTMAIAKAALKDNPSLKEIGTIMNWSLSDAAGLTAEERKEILDLKNQAVDTMSSKKRK